MDIGTQIQDKADHDSNDAARQRKSELNRALMVVETDLAEAVRLCEALKELEHNHSWITFQNILIQPALVKVRMEIEGLNRELGKKDVVPDEKNKISAQLIYDNSFYEVLMVMCDFEHIRKDNENRQKLLQGRIKELTNQLNK